MDWKTAKNTNGNLYQIPGDWLKIEYFEVLNILFRVENALRVFTYIILKNEFKDKWKDLSVTSDDEENSTIAAIARKRISQAKNHAYLGYSLNSPLLHLTSGELIRVITSEKYWKLFKPFFLGSKEIIKNKLDEIGTVRNSVAHFRPIKQGDVELVKQNSIHSLSEIEKTLNDFILCSDTVPTNTNEKWYNELKTLESNECRLAFRQSKKEEWTRVELTFKSPIIASTMFTTIANIKAYNIKSISILNKFNLLLKYVISVTETTPHIFTNDPKKIKIEKSIKFTFSSKELALNYESIKTELESLLLTISEELKLIQLDSLARGSIVEAVSFFIEKPSDSNYFSPSSNVFLSELDDNTPVEFWGVTKRANSNYITTTEMFPWIPIKISEDKDELPF